MTSTSYVDEWLCIMYKLGFIDPKINPHLQPTLKDEYRTARIFFIWISSASSTPQARINGAKIGRIIHSRAKFKGLNLRDVARMLTQAGDYYLTLVDRIETEMDREKDDEAWGTGGRKEKGEMSEEEKKDRKKLMDVGRLMMVFMTAALGEVEKELKGTNSKA